MVKIDLPAVSTARRIETLAEKAAGAGKNGRRRAPFFIFATILASSFASCDYFLKDAVPWNISEIEKKVFSQINAKRVANGQGTLIWNDVIADTARGHSQDMADGTVPFGHEGFADRFAAICLILPAAAGAENIAYAPSVETAISAWMNSPAHRGQIYGNYDYTGVGVVWKASAAEYYFTQIFIRAR